MYVVGKTGTGKSHLLRLLIEQDILRGEGCALLNPHGELASEVAKLVPEHRRQDLVFLDATDPSLRWAFDPFANVPEDKHALAAAGLVETFKKLWSEEWGPRLEHLFRNVVFTLLEPEIREAVFGNVGTVVSFRVGAADAQYLSREFAPVFSDEDLIALPRFHIYLRLLIEGKRSRPFSATTFSSVAERSCLIRCVTRYH